jgi:hypothetical protein
MQNPKELIEQIVARVPNDRAGYTNWHVGPVPFEFAFYQQWVAPKESSLPTSLPTDLFVEEAEK